MILDSSRVGSLFPFSLENARELDEGVLKEVLVK
jgi:hypothetical protein